MRRTRIRETFDKKTTLQIIQTYAFSHRFLAYFISQIAKQEMKQVKNSDPRSLKAIEISERYGNGEDFSKEELKKVLYDASDSYVSANNHYAAYAAFTAATYAAASTFPTLLLVSPNHLFHRIDGQKYKPLLLELIKTRLTKLEKLLVFGIT